MNKIDVKVKAFEVVKLGFAFAIGQALAHMVLYTPVAMYKAHEKHKAKEVLANDDENQN